MAEKANKEQIFDKIKEIVIDQADVDPNKITMSSTFEDLGLDSLDVFEMIDALEDAYDIEIDGEDADDGMSTVSDVVDYVAQKLDEK